MKKIYITAAEAKALREAATIPSDACCAACGKGSDLRQSRALDRTGRVLVCGGCIALWADGVEMEARHERGILAVSLRDGRAALIAAAPDLCVAVEALEAERDGMRLMRDAAIARAEAAEAQRDAAVDVLLEIGDSGLAALMAGCLSSVEERIFRKLIQVIDTDR